jgi:hypothetical protein
VLAALALVLGDAAVEWDDVRQALSARPRSWSAPSGWLLRTPETLAMRALLAEIDPLLAPAEPLYVVADLPPGEAFFLPLWVAYLLPGQEVLGAATDAPFPAGAAVLAYRSAPVPAAWRAVAGGEAGTLYRVAGAGADPPPSAPG